ncbi:CBS domain-containing protein [Thauera sp.]|jgi:CBS domain-containing protein|uniref:CBS domain-containing protein n=1 Tax=Thauera sp. TaxID=1905334 RepID=UPI002A365E79|nr:CBS domain-containing protein [Thauera sp.]MDX9885505.1 CBS domain-containing protein [Thauera sp.]
MTNRNISFIVKDQNPLMLRPTDTVQTACQRMCERRVGAVLVTDTHAHLKGIFTGRDAVQVIAGGGNPGAIHLSAVMTPDPDSIAPERTAIDALHMMCDGGYRHLPVVIDGKGGGKVVGIVSRSDFKGLELDHFEDEQSLWERIC